MRHLESLKSTTEVTVDQDNFFEKSVFSLKVLLNEVVEELLPFARTKSVKINVINELKSAETVSSDPVRLKLVLVNIIGNALKFVQGTEINVFVNWKDTSKNISRNSAQLLQITVEESKTVKKDPTRGRQFGGFRLELYQTKHIARILGGDVVLRFSSPDMGASYVATFLVNQTCETYLAQLVH